MQSFRSQKGKVMNLTVDSQKTVDHYLNALRKELRELLEDDVRDIVEEIHAHILDKAGADPSPEALAETLAALGPPEKLALRYRTEELLHRARRGRSAGRILRDSLRWIVLGLSGLIVFLLSAAGYGIGGFLVWLGSMKALHPHRTSVDLQFSSTMWTASFQSGGPPRGHDPFGLWLAPIGILGGALILYLTFRFGSWGVRKFWNPRPRTALVPADE
jgi:hypothetical protein